MSARSRSRKQLLDEGVAVVVKIQPDCIHYGAGDETGGICFFSTRKKDIAHVECVEAAERAMPWAEWRSERPAPASPERVPEFPAARGSGTLSALDEAVLAFRQTPSLANRVALDGAARKHMTAFHKRQGASFIERQQ